jgi:uncharacterized protein
MNTPQLSRAERLILANQYRILALVDEQNASSNENNAEILLNGYTGLYHNLFDSLSDEVPESVTEEIHNILSMFRTLENSIASLPAGEKQQLHLTRLGFEGFDGNNDDHYHIAKFMVEKQELYDEYEKHSMNSHSSASLPRYRRQLAVFNRVHQSMQNLTLADLKQVEAA